LTALPRLLNTDHHLLFHSTGNFLSGAIASGRNNLKIWRIHFCKSHILACRHPYEPLFSMALWF